MAKPTIDEFTAGRRATAIARHEGDEVTARTQEFLLAKVPLARWGGKVEVKRIEDKNGI